MESSNAICDLNANHCYQRFDEDDYNFTPLEAGTFSRALFSDLANENEGLFLLPDGQFDIATNTKVEVVPIPATLLLFGSTLAGIIIYRLLGVHA